MINFEEALNHTLSTVSLMYVVGLMALIRVVTAIPETFEDLALKLISIYLTKGYLLVDLVQDCYLENPIKTVGKTKRDSAT